MKSLVLSFIFLILISQRTDAADFDNLKCSLCKQKLFCFTIFYDNPFVCFYLCKEKCYKKSEVGPCEGYFEKWFYNKETCKCEKFAYGGCDGNENRFDDEDECMKECP